MHTLRILFFAFFCSAAGLLCAAQELSLTLTNGDRISGQLVSESESELTIKTSYADKLVLPKAMISKRESTVRDSKPAPAEKPAKEAPPAEKGPSKAKPAPSSPAPPEKPLDKPEAKAGVRKFLDDWKGELEVGLNLGFGTKDRQTYTGRLRANHLHMLRSGRSLHNDLDYLASYGTAEGVLVDNRMDGSWKIEYDIGKRFSVYNAAGAGFDEVRKIDLRYDLGPGVGYKWINLTNFVLETELGANYQEQFFADGTDRTRYSLRLAEEATWQVNSRIRVDEKIEFFPEVDDFTEFRVRLEGNLSYLLRGNLTLKLTVINLYETEPAQNVSKNDLQVRSSLGWKF